MPHNATQTPASLPPHSPAMQRALDEIGRRFGPWGVNDSLKRQVRRFMRLGVDHPAVKARYGARAAMLRGVHINLAVALVDGLLRGEQIKFAHQSVIGSPSRLSVQVLTELRLILRFMRAADVDLADSIDALLGKSL